MINNEEVINRYKSKALAAVVMSPLSDESKNQEALKKEAARQDL